VVGRADVAGAIADYDEAIRLNPQDADVYQNRGIARRALGNVAGAIADYDQALGL
jgi:Flp pilus assembly protein TadD